MRNPVDLWAGPRDGESFRFPRHSNGPPMNIVLQPWQLVLAILSGWVHQRQRQIIEFQDSMIISLMQSQGKKRLLLTDDQRRLLAVNTRAVKILKRRLSSLTIWF